MVNFLSNLLRSPGWVIFFLILPGLWPIWPILHGNPTVAADPLKYILHHLGFTASVVLAIVLTFSPLRVLFPKFGPVLALNRHRRLVGVTAFLYALLHVSTHFLYEGGFASFPKDLQKPFIFTGLMAFTILLILALTSLQRMVRWLGAKRWKWLHRMVYLAVGLVIYHQISARKLFPVQVLWIFLPLLALEFGRIIITLRRQSLSVTPTRQ